MHSSPPDVVGLGALNIDYIASASRLSRRASELISESTARFEWNTEGHVDEMAIEMAMSQLGTAAFDASLGGSAWNTILALANMNGGIHLGYVGVLGRVEAPGLSFTKQMSALNIDHQMVASHLDQRSGVCISFIDDAERVMLTHPGANLEMASYIKENFDALATYLAAARLVHVTSFLDTQTPGQVLRILLEAIRRNPSLIISFDPGHEWALHADPEVLGILKLTNLLFVNYREFKALANYSHGERDEVLGERIIGLCGENAVVFVTKRYDLVEVFTQEDHGLRVNRFTHDFPDATRDIEDATGAGDVFAASAICSLMSRKFQVELGAFLGLSLARHKMQHFAFSGHSRFPDLTRGFLQNKESPSVPLRRNDAVLVAHDGSPEWSGLKDFLEGCGLHTEELTPTAGHSSLSSLSRQQLDRSNFAVCILRRRRDAHGETERADERMVHYAGFLQGRYGFARVAVLVEDGCETFSNMAGLIRLDFRSGHVESAFIDLERMLRREGILK